MKKLLKWAAVCLALFALYQGASLLSDKQQLRDGLIRLHVVADSDSEEDQTQKYKVRDAVMAYLEPLSQTATTKQEAAAYIQQHLTQLEEVANKTLAQCGSAAKAAVTLTQEAFGTRDYDTFSLPAGIYDSLRIEIGSGQGKNWWCVIFPSLCLQASTQQVSQTASCAGMSQSLQSTITGEEGYEVRFFLLECLGKLENFFKS